ncbi:Hypothetical predicted protein [Podarcis lilfordi]|uniref:Uncharacterized protein n=1 Tax=Podarcis lilfordi TaxID=74358 RepID=A0AA35PKV5_9SAUR|nr:Hypothetical predicted protein [Podarcis lilfordi]
MGNWSGKDSPFDFLSLPPPPSASVAICLSALFGHVPPLPPPKKNPHGIVTALFLLKKNCEPRTLSSTQTSPQCEMYIACWTLCVQCSRLHCNRLKKKKEIESRLGCEFIFLCVCCPGNKCSVLYPVC